MTENGKALCALLLGAAAGVAIGLLIAPEKGSELRKKIKEGASDLIDKLGEELSEGKDKINDIKEKARSTVSEIKEVVMDKAEQLKADADKLRSSQRNA